jgi:hypothetical protein
MLRKLILFLSLIFILSNSFEIASAQCPMCRMSAESDLKNGGTKSKGLNAGIMYMLVFPYILIGSVGFVWYRERKKIAEEEQTIELRALLEPHDWK